MLKLKSNIDLSVTRCLVALIFFLTCYSVPAKAVAENSSRNQEQKVACTSNLKADQAILVSPVGPVNHQPRINLSYKPIVAVAIDDEQRFFAHSSFSCHFSLSKRYFPPVSSIYILVRSLII